MPNKYPSHFQLLVFLLLSAIVIISIRCANIIAPTGGARDETPPRIVESESTSNFQTNFKGRSFKLTYDEWITLTNQTSQVVVSPPLQYIPDVRLKKRSVIFEFNEKETLREDATYVINFGESIKDYTEGNEATATFVFATGDYIDSLSVSATVVNALTKKPEKEVLVMLYDNLSDTAFQKERPFYFGKTDASGKVTINNLKSDTFQIVAIRDGNLNFLFDNVTEPVGFLDTLVFLGDSVPINLNLKLFIEEASVKFRSIEQDQYGKATLIFNASPDSVGIQIGDQRVDTYYEVDQDSILLWYDMPESQSFPIYLEVDTLRDTITVKKKDKADFLKEANLQLKSFDQTAFDYEKDLTLQFNHPLRKIDTAAIYFYTDTISNRIFPVISMDSVDERSLHIQYRWKQGTPYGLILPPDAITDLYGLTTKDTITQNYTSATEKDFGNIVLLFDDLKKDTAYVAKLMDDQKEIIETFYIENTTTDTVEVSKLLPGKYSIELIEDVDKNKRWTTGNYSRRQQPERIKQFPLEELRAQWDLEATISPSALEEGK